LCFFLVYFLEDLRTFLKLSLGCGKLFFEAFESFSQTFKSTWGLKPEDFVFFLSLSNRGLALPIFFLTKQEAHGACKPWVSFFQMFKNRGPKALDFLLAHATNTLGLEASSFFLYDDQATILYNESKHNILALVGKANKCNKKCIIINLASMLLCLTRDDRLIN